MRFKPRLMLPVLAGIHFVAIPMYPRLPLAVLFAVAFLTLWSWLLFHNRVQRPGKVMLPLLVLMVVGLLFHSYGTIFGRQAGSTMLLLLAFLKLFETKRESDIITVVFMGYFLIASNFFFSQSALIAIYVIAVVIYLTSLLIIISDKKNSTRLLERLQRSSHMVVLAIPIMLILFVLFPRISGPLWGLPKDDSSATTGLSDEMSPGSINRLITSGEVAFRVYFDGEPPPHSELYWRGLVLSNYDGKTWRRDDAPVYAKPMLVDPDENDSSIGYTVMLEPHNQRWLYALEHLVDIDGTVNVSREMQLYTKNNITDVVSYAVRSDAQLENQGLFEQEYSKNLLLPSGMNPQTVGLAQALYAEVGQDDDAYINRVLKYFRERDFIYTLSPQLLGDQAMDDFIFNTQQGFCGHFSSAFVYLLRAAGIPARVVIGYQGGSMHPFDDYMIVRQSDAHAWTEVWNDYRGWVRIDPTAAVEPRRVESGIENAVDQRELLPSILVSDNALFRRARFMLDSFHSNWNQWVVGFNKKKQKELFELLGFSNVSISDLVLMMVVAMTLAGAVAAWWVVRKDPRSRKDTVKHYYDKFCFKLNKAGVEHQSCEGASEFLQRISSRFPHKKNELALITGDYERLRYGSDHNEQRLKRFIRSVRQLKL